MQDIRSTIDRVFRQKSIVIVGDLVADQFLNGTISRVSREAPVFILRHDDTATVPGAAANAAVNVASLGGKPILVGCIGKDPNAIALLDSLVSSGVNCEHIQSVDGMRTTTKVRVLAAQHYAARQQVIRIDYEDGRPLVDEVKKRLLDALSDAASSANAIVLSDYGYGVIFDELVERARSLSRSLGIPLIVDSRYSLEKLANATSATPNREEVKQILGADFTSEQCEHLRERLQLEALLVTNGNQGMSLFERGKAPLHIPVVGSAEPVDVTGAGDTVIAAYTLCLAAGLGFAGSALVANHAGGIVVMKKGTAAATRTELIDSLAAEPGWLSSNA